MTQIATEAGHWYTATGEPCYTVIGKNGNERPTTLWDARKLNLAPSVTMIMDCADKPALNQWKLNQVLMAAATLPKIDGEAPDEWMARVLADSKEQAIKARDLGSLIHGCIEKCLSGRPYDTAYEKHVKAACLAVDEWCGLRGIRPEKSFAHPLGYGGKVDAHKKPEIDIDINHPGFVVDFKTKDFCGEDMPLRCFKNHAMQLAAYREGFEMPDARCAIVYVSTKDPGLTQLTEIDADDLTQGWEMFQALVQYWQAEKNYAPN